MNNITESQSKAYWQSASPLAITDWDVDGTNTDLLIKNMTTEEIRITAVTLDTTAVNVTDANIMAGNQSTFTGTGVTCTTGNPYNYDVVITYSVVDGLQGAKQTGAKPLVGTCS